MKRMSDDELALYQIIKNNRSCRNSNWEATRAFYKIQYGVDLPDLKGLPTPSSIDRTIRMLKSLYPKDLTDSEERKIKEDQITKYKEAALDKNKPVKEEQTRLEWW